MFKALVRAIDGLFYETTTTIHRTTKRVYSNPDTIEEIRAYCRDNGITICRPDGTTIEREVSRSDICPIRRCETTVLSSETEFVVGDLIIPIPENIRKLIPVEKVDIGYFSAFPIEQSTNIWVMFEEPKNRFTADYGEKPVPDSDIITHDEMRDHIETMIDLTGSDEVTVASAHYNDIRVSSFIYPGTDFLHLVSPVGYRVSISIPNTREEDDYAKDTNLSVTAACIFARAFLITMRKAGKSIAEFNEHDLRSTILALLLTDRSGN